MSEHTSFHWTDLHHSNHIGQALHQTRTQQHVAKTIAARSTTKLAEENTDKAILTRYFFSQSLSRQLKRCDVSADSHQFSHSIKSLLS